VAQQADLNVRMSVNTGEALVVLGASPVQGEHLASGDVLNTAARLQSAAPVNGILVGEQTYRATERVIEYRQHDPVEAKGKAEPVPVWEAVQARSRFGIDVEQAPRTALIGRERELRLLKETFERAREERQLQLVTLVGVPGIGKSRVVYEFSRLIDADPQLVVWRQGRCLPYGDGVSFWALAEMVKAQAGILESEGSETVESKLSATVKALVAPADADWVLRRLKPLVGRDGEERSQSARAESFAAWRRFLEGIAERGPAVLVFEDLHWADEGLLDFVNDLAEWTTGVPLVIVCTARPELMAKRPGWGGGRANALTLSLPSLSAGETAQLVHDLLARAVLPEELEQAVLERAGGNPLYAEEFARMVIERGVTDLAVPESVQGIIASRLDALAPEHKRRLQNAAVVGKVFWRGAVTALDAAIAHQLERELRELERRELIRRERVSSVEGEAEYAFRHVLIRDVAYGQIPRAERSVKHRRAAEWIASLGRPEDHAELLAHHYLNALEYARASGTNSAAFATPAMIAFRDAGERAMALGAYPSAVQYFGAGLELAPPDSAEHAQLLFRYGNACRVVDRTGEDALEQALEALRPLDRETAARAALLLSDMVYWRGDRRAALEWSADVDELLSDLPDSIVQVEALVYRADRQMLAGDDEDAIHSARAALKRLEGGERPDLRAWAFSVIGVSRVALGDEAGMIEFQRAIEIARAEHAIAELLRALNNRDSCRVQLGLLRELDQGIEERQRTMQEMGSTAHTRDFVLTARASADYFAGRWNDALAVVEGFQAGLAEGAAHYLESAVRATRALIRLARDHMREARADAERAVTVAALSRDPQVLAPSLCARASVRLAMRSAAEARADFEKLIALGDGLADGLNDDAALPSFAWLALDLGRAADAEQVVSCCRSRRWAEVGNAILAGDAAAAADLLSDIGHRPAEGYARLRAGGDQLNQALAFYRSVGATRYIHEAESQLAASA
jgi:tetratricopeptide (TPR) repeat protein